MKKASPPSILSPVLVAAIEVYGVSQLGVICAVALHLQAHNPELLKPDADKPSIPVGFSRAMWLCNPTRDASKEDAQVKTFANLATVGLKVARWNKANMGDYSATTAGDTDALVRHLTLLASASGYTLTAADIGNMATDKLSTLAQAKLRAKLEKKAEKAAKAQHEAQPAAPAAPAVIPPVLPVKPTDETIGKTDGAKQEEVTPGEVTYIARCTDRADNVLVDMGRMPDHIRMHLLTAIISDLGAAHCSELSTLLDTRMKALVLVGQTPEHKVPPMVTAIRERLAA